MIISLSKCCLVSSDFSPKGMKILHLLFQGIKIVVFYHRGIKIFGGENAYPAFKHDLPRALCSSLVQEVNNSVRTGNLGFSKQERNSGSITTIRNKIFLLSFISAKIIFSQARKLKYFANCFVLGRPSRFRYQNLSKKYSLTNNGIFTKV